ncbi:uncharacterized protein LOC119639491 [Glossina fuscipes]|uniref:Uncharacterized protein LOC119639491 n=1 Tax=Glossina fuscipes TaxID=7396 RepID=A0A9C5ZB25_9MUSC|nr:uncharacterized protein LOC119639491 [Glossina fuscipes]
MNNDKIGKLSFHALLGEIEIRSLTEDKLEASLDVLNNSFFLMESVSIATEINLPQNVNARKELRELCRLTAQDGVSLVAIEKCTDTLVGVSFNKIQFSSTESEEEPFFVKFRNKSTHTSQAQALMDFMITVDSEQDVFKKFDLTSVCELMFLAILPTWQKRGIGRALTAAAIELTRHLSKGNEDIKSIENFPKPQAVTALFTSRYSQRIGQSLGFRLLNTVPYTKFHFNGKAFNERIDSMHDCCQHVIYFV